MKITISPCIKTKKKSYPYIGTHKECTVYFTSPNEGFILDTENSRLYPEGQFRSSDSSVFCFLPDFRHAVDRRMGRPPSFSLSGPIHKYDGIWTTMHPDPQRCSSVKYHSGYSPSSRLAPGPPPVRTRCKAWILLNNS